MKRYGDNLPAKEEPESEYTPHHSVAVIRGGCGVRYEMLAFLQPKEIPQKRRFSNLLDFFKSTPKPNEKSDG